MIKLTIGKKKGTSMRRSHRHPFLCRHHFSSTHTDTRFRRDWLSLFSGKGKRGYPLRIPLSPVNFLRQEVASGTRFLRIFPGHLLLTIQVSQVVAIERSSRTAHLPVPTLWPIPSFQSPLSAPSAQWNSVASLLMAVFNVWLPHRQ